jgi:hypothetical protein
MVHTRAAFKHSTAASDKGPDAIDKKTDAHRAKKAKDAERARLAEISRICYAAQQKRDAAAAASYIGTMKYLGAT